MLLSPFARADLLRASHGLAVPSHQGAPTGSLQRQHRRQRRALSLRRDTWARDAQLEGIGLGQEPRHQSRAKYIVSLVIRSRANPPQAAYIRYVCDLARY